MNRRLYFVLPNTNCAHKTFNDLLLSRVNANDVHFLAKAGIPLGDLPEASVSERTGLIEGGAIGMGLGALLGLVAGMLAVWIPPWPFTIPVPMAAVPICTIFGMVAGGVWTSLAATAIPNSKLELYKEPLDQGEILMIVRAPFRRSREIRALVSATHPEIHYGGTWPTEHVVFP